MSRPDSGSSCGNTSKEGKDVEFLFSSLQVHFSNPDSNSYGIRYTFGPIARSAVKVKGVAGRKDGLR